MKRFAVACFVFAAATAAHAADITGAGSTFVYPVLAKWADAYKKEKGVGVNYQSIGSGGGIKQIESKTVEFGATDKPLDPAELEKNGLAQFPLINGTVVPVINVEGAKAGDVKLDGKVLGDIFLGKVKTWDDKEIAALNPGVKLPATAITVVHRADSSGTSYVWTSYLSKVSPDWKAKVGEGTAVSWPTGVAGKGNEGVAAYVQKLKGAIGYVEYAYALQNKMNYAKLESPVVGTTYVLMHKAQENPQLAKATLDFFRWAYAHPDMAKELDYVPLAPDVVKRVEAEWKKTITANGAAVL